MFQQSAGQGAKEVADFDSGVGARLSGGSMQLNSHEPTTPGIDGRPSHAKSPNLASTTVCLCHRSRFCGGRIVRSLARAEHAGPVLWLWLWPWAPRSDGALSRPSGLRSPADCALACSLLSVLPTQVVVGLGRLGHLLRWWHEVRRS